MQLMTTSKVKLVKNAKQNKTKQTVAKIVDTSTEK